VSYPNYPSIVWETPMGAIYDTPLLETYLSLSWVMEELRNITIYFHEWGNFG
jgi:hypothetical protein